MKDSIEIVGKEIKAAASNLLYWAICETPAIINELRRTLNQKNIIYPSDPYY
jgi:hypothetical protein